MKLWQQEFWEGSSALGGFPIYVIVILFFASLGKLSVAQKLIIMLLIMYGVTGVLRLLFFRERPIIQPRNSLLEKIDAGGFPSLHSIRATVLAIVIGVFFHNIFVWVISGVCVVLTGVARIVLKRHDLIDVFSGILIGIVLGVFAAMFL